MRGARADARDAREVSLNAPRRAARARRPDECGIRLARTASRCNAHRTHEEVPCRCQEPRQAPPDELRGFENWQERVDAARVRRFTPRVKAFMKDFYSL